MTFCIICHDARPLAGGKCRRCLQDLARAHHRKAGQCLDLARAFAHDHVHTGELLSEANKLRMLAYRFEALLTQGASA